MLFFRGIKEIFFKLTANTVQKNLIIMKYSDDFLKTSIKLNISTVFIFNNGAIKANLLD